MAGRKDESCSTTSTEELKPNPRGMMGGLYKRTLSSDRDSEVKGTPRLPPRSRSSDEYKRRTRTRMRSKPMMRSSKESLEWDHTHDSLGDRTDYRSFDMDMTKGLNPTKPKLDTSFADFIKDRTIENSRKEIENNRRMLNQREAEVKALRDQLHAATNEINVKRQKLPKI